MTTAPRTLMMTGMEPEGKDGVTHPTAADVQLILATQISNRKDNPIRETNAIIIFSIFTFFYLINEPIAFMKSFILPLVCVAFDCTNTSFFLFYFFI